MKNKEKYYLLLNRFTNLEIKKEDVEDYLNECNMFNTKPTSIDFFNKLFRKSE